MKSCADLREEIQLSIFLLRFDVSFQEISIVADASEWRASVVEAFEAAQCEYDAKQVETII